MEERRSTVTQWCVGIGEEQKRFHDDDSEQEQTCKWPKRSVDQSGQVHAFFAEI